MINTKNNNNNQQSSDSIGVTIESIEQRLLKDFNTARIENTPSTEKELLQYYSDNTDVLFQYLRAIVNKNLFVVSNEIRALLGHLSDYRINPNETKRDLEKAYGHFRRMNLDLFKILCDEYDKFLSKQLRKDYGYDYRNIRPNYLTSFAKQYFDARQSYLKAQTDERTGCDSDVHAIIELYHEAAKKYIILQQFYVENKTAITKVKVRSIVRNIFLWSISVIGAFAGIISLL